MAQDAPQAHIWQAEPSRPTSHTTLTDALEVQAGPMRCTRSPFQDNFNDSDAGTTTATLCRAVRTDHRRLAQRAHSEIQSPVSETTPPPPRQQYGSVVGTSACGAPSGRGTSLVTSPLRRAGATCLLEGECKAGVLCGFWCSFRTLP